MCGRARSPTPARAAASCTPKSAIAAASIQYISGGLWKKGRPSSVGSRLPRSAATTVSFTAPGGGEYYGVQGTTWRDAPMVELAGLLTFRELPVLAQVREAQGAHVGVGRAHGEPGAVHQQALGVQHARQL